MKNRNQNISSDSFTPRIPAPRHWLQAPEEIAARGFSSFIRSPRSSLPQLPSAHSWIDSAAATSALSDFGDSRRRSSNPGSTAVLSSNRFALSSDLHDHWRFWPLLPWQAMGEDNDLESDRSYGDAKPLRALQREAGVRRLPKSDSDWLLDKAWTILKKSSFLCRRDWIKLISGMEEAYYGKFVGTEAGLNNKLQLKHPCLNNGYRDKYTCSRCASVNLDGSPLTGGKTMSKKKNGIVVELIGAPQWEECRSLARLTVNRSAGSNFSSGIDCELKPCALSDGLPQPRGKFYAMSGDGRLKTPLSPTISGSQQHPFSVGHGLGGSSIHLSESSVLPLVVSHSYSSGSLGQMQFGSGAGSFWPPHRGKATLSSRRSQSREDLNSSLADAHVVKV
ncbi:hypothetical protein GW17_00048285 [Ensete ventricosum]|nr:hypothetical protein GW17_00048285 [Ensete ventricosum]